MREHKRHLDWEAIEKQYRAGHPSVREIARLNGIDEKMIRKKASEKGWTRDLTDKVGARVRAELTKAAGMKAGLAQTDEQIVEAAAMSVVEVVQAHRAQAERGASLVRLMFHELEAATTKQDEIQQDIVAETVGDRTSKRRENMLAAISLPARAKTIDNLASAVQKFANVARDAWGLNDKRRPDDLASMTEEQLRARLAEIDEKMGRLEG